MGKLVGGGTRRVLSVALVLLGVGIIGWAVVRFFATPTEPAPPAGEFSVAPSSVVDRATPTAPPSMGANELRIPAIDAQAPIDRFGIDNSRLLLPTADRVALYRDGAQPGDAAGTVLVAGHVTSRATGPGALFKLAQVKPGDDIWITGKSGQAMRYVVVALEVFHKRALPQDLFTAKGPQRLVVVTCGGDIVTTSTGRAYDSNVVVTAVPLGGRPTPNP